MADQRKYRLKAKKMFKAVVGGGGLPQMVNPGDVIETDDRYLAWALVNQEKAEMTDEKPYINPNYRAPERPASSLDPISLFTRAVEHFTKAVQELAGGGRQGKLGH